MHSFGDRATAFVTYSATIAALMWAMTSFSDNFNSPSPSAQIQMLNINRFQKQSHGDDECLDILSQYHNVVSEPNPSPRQSFKRNISLTMNITANLQSVFTWNTKQLFVFVAAEYETPKNALNQVSLWDAIIPAKEYANFWIQTENNYQFVDQGSNLRGTEFNLTLQWHVMPKIGKMFADKLVMSRYRLPEE